MQHTFMIETLKKRGVEGNPLDLRKGVRENLATDITLGGKRRCFCPKMSETGYLLLPFLSNMVLEVPARALRREKIYKRHPDWKGKSKTIYFSR